MSALFSTGVAVASRSSSALFLRSRLVLILAGLWTVAAASGASAFTISGRMMDPAVAGVPNVRIESTGEVEDGVVTDAQGFYILEGAAAGSYTLTAEHVTVDNALFSPASRTVSVVNYDLEDVN